jgi:predicted O-methyltransferase YrrM
MEIPELLKNMKFPPMRRYISVRPIEGEFIQRWVKEHGLHNTLEIGFAFGMSACCILSAHEDVHTCIDPFQEKDYQSMGLSNVAALGFSDRLRFHQAKSDVVLPQLLAEKKKYDFAFIDGSHLYDGIFLDFYYVDQLLQDQGYVLFHDGWMRGTQLVASFIRRNRKDYRRIRCPVKNLLLFQKIGVDDRPFQHFHEFYTWKSFFAHPIIRWMIRRNILQKYFKKQWNA